MQVYLVRVSTGGECQGAYSSLEKAQEAVAAHYLAIGGSPEYNFEWKEHCGFWFSEDTPDVAMEYISISVYVLDEELPMV